MFVTWWIFAVVFGLLALVNLFKYFVSRLTKAEAALMVISVMISGFAVGQLWSFYAHP